MGPTRIAILIVAAVCSIGLAFLVLNVMSGKKPAAPAAAAAQQPMTRVLVAQRDLKVGERIEPASLGWQSWPQGSVNALFITDGAARDGAAGVAQKALEAVTPGPALQSVQGAIVREPILANEPILQRKLVRGGEGGFMSVMLKPGMRAVAVPVTAESGVGGFVLPNDHVDVILSRKIEVEARNRTVKVAVANTVMRNLRVLAVDQKIAPDKDAASIIGAVVTLEVPEKDVEYLAAAKADGDLLLSLRAYTDAGGAAGRVMADANNRADQTVNIYRGGQGNEVRIAQ